MPPETADLLVELQKLAARRFGPAAAELGPHDDLFDVLGIDSLQALDLMTDLEGAFRVEIPDYELQGVTTLAGLAEVIRRKR
jgi:acyl carrier protein